MIVRSVIAILILIVSAGPLFAERVPSLRGSPAGMQRQNQVARDHGLAFYRTRAEIMAAVEAGDLMELRGNENYSVADFVDLPYLQPAGVLFVERLSAQYREACGQKLVVTSAVRATTRQPANAHALSVHPAGMAVDLRVSDRAACRSWLEDAILGMERRGVIDGIREYHPPHYHIAIFPNQYMEYALERAAAEAERLAAAEPPVVEPVEELVVPEVATALIEGESTPQPASSSVTVLGVAVALVALPFGIGYLVRRFHLSDHSRSA